MSSSATLMHLVDTGDTNEDEILGNEKLQHIMEEEDIKETEKTGWGNQLDFLFSLVGYAVGIGNIWRFPYLCYKNGGGAFLVPYFVAFFTCGVPMFLLETSIGQYLGVGIISMMEQLCPILKGVGYAITVAVSLMSIYYIVVVAWSIFYFISSFYVNPELPWEGCHHDWNTKYCFDIRENFTDSWLHANNLTLHNSSPPVQEFWERRVLSMSSGIDDLEGVHWELLLCLLAAWVVCYLIIWKGLQASGKVIWFLALFPYLVLSILLVRAVTLPGAYSGILFYLEPDWNKLKSAETWLDGGTQIFFSYGIALGSLPALGSYNKFHHNAYRDTLIVCLINSGTSLFAGFVTFSILGHMAHLYDTTVAKVVKSGPGLIFLVYPEVVSTIPLSSFFSVIFFFMMIILGTNTQFCQIEGIIVSLIDNWTEKLASRRKLVTLVLCITLFILGLPLTTNGGVFLFGLMDFYSASGITLLWICFFETIAITWVWGTNNILGAMEKMFGFRPSRYWIVCWAGLGPLVMVSIFLMYCIKWEPLKFGGSYTYPNWSQVMGWMISLTSMLAIPVYAIYYIIMTPGKSRMEVIRKGFTSKLILRVEAMDCSKTTTKTYQLTAEEEEEGIEMKI